MSKILKDRLEKEIYKKLEQDSLFGLEIGVLKKGKTVFKNTYGKSYRYFDLASMTKAIFTADYFLRRPELRNKKISKLLPWAHKTNIKTVDLLNHESGLPAHKKFFKDLSRLPLDERSVALKKALRFELEKNSSRKILKKAVYSDLGFLVLGFVIEEIERASLKKVFERDNKIKGLHFNEVPFNGDSKLYAPTEVCLWRNKKLQGEVLDGNAFSMGGVAPHAGLFGATEDVLSYGQSLRRQFKKSPTLFKAKNKEWASGFMIPSGEKTTAGKHFSKKSVGHLGFTGTSFWYDPEADLFVSILSNRTYPDRLDKKFNAFRPLIHNIIFEEMILK